MSSTVSSTQSSTPILVTTPSTDTKSFIDHKRDDSSDDQRQQLNKQQSKTYTRGNSNKNKQLTRSHAMKESTSPPRTPNSNNSHSPCDMKSHSPTAPTLGTSSDEAHLSASSSQHLSAPTPIFVLPQSEINISGGKSQLDIEFPKLTPPKTKVGWNSPTGSRNNRKSVSSDTSSNNNSLCEEMNESHDNKAAHQQQQPHKSGSQTISLSTSASHQMLSPQSERKQQQSYTYDNDCEKCSIDSYNPNEERVMISPSRAQCSPSYSHNDNNNNNNNNGNGRSIASHPLNVKGKPPLKNMGSSSSFEGGNTSSGFISRDSSSEQFVDQNGIDLVQFFKETLNKNAKDRNMLMKIERELLQLAVDQTGRTFIKFPPMSSYNRMLVHRTAAYFGMDHNVDSTQQSVIASTTKETRIPEIRFKTLIRDTFSEEPRRSILKRETHSFEDYRHGGLLSVQRNFLNRKAKSFEERDEENEKEWQWMHDGGGGEMSNKMKVPIRLTKIHHHSQSMDGHRSQSYGHHPQLMRDDSITSNKSFGGRMSKQDSMSSTTWRLSPSSSGYKTQSLRSDSVTPSPTADTPEPSSHSPDGRGVVWAVTDLASVPKGSLIIDPTTLQPILNQDGSLYHYDPSNPPASIRYSNTRKKADRHKTMNNNNGKPNSSRENLTNNNLINNCSGQDTENPAILMNNNNKYSKTNISTITTNNVDNVDVIEDDGDDDEEEDEEQQIVEEIATPKISEDSYKTKDEFCENKSSQCEQKSHLNAEELMSPKQKNQSTSPNLPLNETIISEEEESVTPTSCIQPVVEEEIITEVIKHGKIDIAPVAITPPVHEIRFQPNPYTQNAAAATPSMPPVLSYASAPSFSAPMESAGTIYHTGPDGTLYVLSQPVMYSYTTSTDNEVPSCWVPISFDQGARDPNLTVMPVATPYNGPTIYQSPMVYSTDQFTNPPAIAGQYPAYPMGYATATYPVNGAPYQNNIWPQPMTTFYLPPSATPAPASVLVPPNAQHTQNATMQSTTSSNTHNPSTNSHATGRRNSPQSNNSASHNVTSQNSNTIPMQTFSTSVPFSLATVSEANSATGQAAIYAIPPSIYPGVLPYHASAPSFYQQLPHPQANTTIISSVIPHSNAHHHHQHHQSAGTVPSTPHSFQTTSSGGEVMTHFSFNQQHPNHGNNNMTPQSAPSTPLSLTTVPPNFKNTSIFATPPIITAAPSSVQITHYDDKKGNNGGTRKTYSSSNISNNNNNGVVNTQSYSSHSKTTGSNGNNQRQGSVNSYINTTTPQQGVKKNINNNYNNTNINNNNGGGGSVTASSSNSHCEDTNSLSNNNMSSNYNSSNRIKTNRDQTSVAGSYQPKSTYKGQHQSNNYTPNSNSGSPNSNDNSEGTTTQHSNSNPSKYPTTRGPSRIPPLDLKRNNSSASMVQNHQTRSTPSTNSTESNNSPNSITSYDHYSRNYHHSYQSHQPPTYGGNGAHYYRGGSAGTVSSNVHHNVNSNGTDSASFQTCFPFNVHSQAPGTPTPLLDSCHPQALIGYNNAMTAGMYVKFGQAFTFANPLPNNRKSPSNDIRPPLAPLAGVYPTMMLPGGPRHHMNPRTTHHNPNYKGNRPQHR